MNDTEMLGVMARLSDEFGDRDWSATALNRPNGAWVVEVDQGARRVVLASVGDWLDFLELGGEPA